MRNSRKAEGDYTVKHNRIMQPISNYGGGLKSMVRGAIQIDR